MRRYLLHLTLLFLTGLLLCACTHDEPEPSKEPGNSKARRTVIVYMVAENSLNNYTGGDLREMLQGKGDIPLDCNLVVYLDDSNMPAIYTFSAQTGKALWKTCPEQNSCDGAVFKSTLQDIITKYPAESYGLIMWSHGSGWLPQIRSDRNAQIPSAMAAVPSQHRTIGVDNNLGNNSDKGSELEIPEMRRRLEELGITWDFIFFDACFMQCVEVDYELRNVCRHVVASPAEIPGDGAPYDLIMSSLFSDAPDATSRLAQIYLDDNKDTIYSGSVKGGLVISVSQSSEMENLARTMSSFIPVLYQDQKQYSLHGAQFYCDINRWPVEYFDLGSAMNLLLASPSDYEVFLRQLHLAYPTRLFTPYWLSNYYNYDQGVITDAEHCACVSMFFPNSKYTSYNARLQDYQWYEAAGWDKTGW